MDPRTYEQQAPLIPQLPQVHLLPQQMITSGTRKDCIRLRGLPYEAQVEHILEFLGEHAKSIVYQGVHMVYNAQVRKRIALFSFFSCLLLLRTSSFPPSIQGSFLCWLRDARMMYPTVREMTQEEFCCFRAHHSPAPR
jgi:hypothetical protein